MEFDTVPSALFQPVTVRQEALRNSDSSRLCADSKSQAGLHAFPLNAFISCTVTVPAVLMLTESANAEHVSRYLGGPCKSSASKLGCC